MKGNKKKYIAVIILAISLFIVFLTVRYYQKYMIHKNIDRLKTSDNKERQVAINNLVKIGKPAVDPLVFALKYDPTYVKHGAAGILSSIIKKKKYWGIHNNQVTPFLFLPTI